MPKKVMYFVKIPYAHYMVHEVYASSPSEAIRKAKDGADPYPEQWSNDGWSRQVTVRKSLTEVSARSALAKNKTTAGKLTGGRQRKGTIR